MDRPQLLQLLDRPALAADWLPAWGLRDPAAAHAQLLALADAGVTLDLLAWLAARLATELPLVRDPDRALADFCRFLAGARSPLSLASLLERDPPSLTTLLQVLGASPRWGRLLRDDPEAFDLLRLTDGAPADRALLAGDIVREVASLADERAVLAALRRFRQREQLRVGFADLFRGASFDLVVQQTTYVAEAAVEAALYAARRKVEQQRSPPRRAPGAEPRLAVIAVGDFGAQQLDYAEPLQLLFVCDPPPPSDAKPAAWIEYCDRWARAALDLLSAATEDGVAYPVEPVLLPARDSAQLVATADAVVYHCDVFGRTWQRQLFLPARAVAGDLELGQAVVQQLQPWIYRRYLSRADETGVRAIKRRLLRLAREAAGDEDEAAGRGGTREIEATVQFLQLLNGGELPRVREANTLTAIAQLEQAGVLTIEERLTLEEGYAWLRRIAHRRQLLAGDDGGPVPNDELAPFVLRRDGGLQGAALAEELKRRRARVAASLDHLLHTAFPADPPAPPETELVLEHAPAAAQVTAALRPYGFRQPEQAFVELSTLGEERIPFLSTRRCRHFLAQIAPRLLEAVGQTPDPDRTLTNLSRVSDSLGGKGVLWELMSVHPPSLQLYVQLCGASPYLSDMLTSSPGMLDPLLDSLLLDKLPRQEELDATLAELCRAADDLPPILAAFKAAQHLRIGVRELLGKEDVSATHTALADVAQACLRKIVEQESARLTERFGTPMTADDGPERPAEFLVLGLGKLGGREPNYHSPLDLAFLFDGDGVTRPEPGQRGAGTANAHFFGQLAQRVVKRLADPGPHGRLYEVTTALRVGGKAGPLAASLADWRRHFAQPAVPLLDRLALCQARLVFGPRSWAELLDREVRAILAVHPWQPEYGAALRQLRLEREAGAEPLNLKRAPGGTLDVEFLVQALQWQAADLPGAVPCGTLAAMQALATAGRLPKAEAHALAESYRFLRRLEAGLRLMNTPRRHTLPEEEAALRQLAMLLRDSDPATLANRCRQALADNRRRFDQFFPPDPAA